MLDNYLDVAEAAKQLSIHSETIKRMIRMGSLPAIKFGNKWLIERHVFDQFAATYMPGPGAKRRLL